ncbi:apolipoprotein C-III [Rhineura floridana]|uniref:apolipoprotein C-III n=1 Tax=Rhineura floridana TaxID=261503 RepID=UPI002AC7FE4A|nr:apolipoprotein C-III [Rhineura floridana]
MRSCPGRLQTATPGKKKEQIQPSNTMKAPLLVLFALLALLAAFARAQEPQEESLLAKVQTIAQQAAEKAQEHLTTLQQSGVAQQAREWFTSNVENAKDYLSTLREKLTSLLEKSAPAA